MNSKSDVDADQQRNYVFRSGDQRSQGLTKQNYLNFFVMGAIWIELMKKIMIGKRTIVIPKIYNNKNIMPTPKQEEIVGSSSEAYEAHGSDKPYNKKHLDLRYDHSSSRHKESDTKWFFTENNENMMIHKRLLPYVVNVRTTMLEIWERSSTSNILKNKAKNKISKIKEHIADPINSVKEKICMSLSVATGVIIGSRSGCGRAIINGGLGALVSGMFCLRKQTEDFFRNLILRSMVADDQRKP